MGRQQLHNPQFPPPTPAVRMGSLLQMAVAYRWSYL